MRQTFGRQFDYRTLWERVSKNGDIVSARAYATDRGDDKRRRFQDALSSSGFAVKLKACIRRRDGSAKGDWDIGITIDVMEAARSMDTVVPLSGDGDFELLLRKIRNDYDVITKVYGVHALNTKSLIEAAGARHAIEETSLL